MNFKKITGMVLIALIVFTISPDLSLAKKVRRIKIDPIPTAHAEDLQTQQTQQTQRTQQTQQKVESVSCDYTIPEKPQYEAKFMILRKQGSIAKNETFEMQVYIQNAGNVPWFSVDSGCDGPVINLGTDKNRDRSSLFFADGLFWNSNWLDTNRIKMDTKRVDPQQTAIFTFWSKAPDKDGLYREFYTPVAEGITWMDGGTFSTDIKVGEPNIDAKTHELLSYVDKSTNLVDVDLSGEKNIEVDLSSQKMWLKIGDYVIKEFPVSSGSARKPTPVGTTYILGKSEVRVAGSYPHYIMPKWMMFRKGGYGFHALPSLANDNGVFWREALSHIGSPRSHGCIRLLPKDAEFAYNFGEVGMKVVVHR
jgi:hypothetical protein